MWKDMLGIEHICVNLKYQSMDQMVVTMSIETMLSSVI